MTRAVSIALNGASGRMGRVLQELLRDDSRLELSACVNASADWARVPELDVVVDFSTPDGFEAALAHCRACHVALVTGTTGLSDAQRQALRDAAIDIPVLHAANFSLGIAVLTQAVRGAAAALAGWDVEIVEAHHARKVDAPSGTALALGRAAADARGQTFDEVMVPARDGHVGARRPGSIGFASVRAADIVGEHSVLIAAPGERLEFTHRATDRAIFARGALAAAAWIVGKSPGVYSLDDVINR